MQTRFWECDLYVWDGQLYTSHENEVVSPKLADIIRGYSNSPYPTLRFQLDCQHREDEGNKLDTRDVVNVWVDGVLVPDRHIDGFARAFYHLYAAPSFHLLER